MEKHIGNREWISQCLLILMTKEMRLSVRLNDYEVRVH